jgi:hypothetical protein
MEAAKFGNRSLAAGRGAGARARTEKAANRTIVFAQQILDNSQPISKPSVRLAFAFY